MNITSHKWIYSVCIRTKVLVRRCTKGIRMKFPGYPNNREADERAKCHCYRREGALLGWSQAGRPAYTFMPLGGRASYIYCYFCI